MRRVLAIGVTLMLAVASACAGTANGPITVRVTLNSANNSSCTSASGSTAGSPSVQVQCNANIYVSIAQVNAPLNGLFSANGGFVTSTQSARDTSDYCRRELAGLADQATRAACGSSSAGGQFDDSVAEEDKGWNVEGQLYSMGPDANRLRLREHRGTLTAVRVSRTGGGFEAIEMLVSF